MKQTVLALAVAAMVSPAMAVTSTPNFDNEANVQGDTDGTTQNNFNNEVTINQNIGSVNNSATVTLDGSEDATIKIDQQNSSDSTVTSISSSGLGNKQTILQELQSNGKITVEQKSGGENVATVQQEHSDAAQPGQNNEIDLVQDGASNTATLRQEGWHDGGYMNVQQVGTGNRLTATQGSPADPATLTYLAEGNDNAGTIEQNGSSDAYVFVDGDSNTTDITQGTDVFGSTPYSLQTDVDIVGDFNEVDITQSGSGNTVDVDINGNHNGSVVDVDPLSVTQSGSANNATVNIVDGDWNTGSLTQAGESDTAIVKIDGSYNYFEVDQSAGADNVADVMVTGDYNNVYSTQSGNGHMADIDLDGSGNEGTLDQSGSNQFAQINLNDANSPFTGTGGGSWNNKITITQAGN